MFKLLCSVAFVSVFFLGCAVRPYQAPTQGPTALLKPPPLKKSYSMIGGMDSRTLYLSEIDASGCIGKLQEIPETAVDAAGLVVVPADKEIAFMAGYHHGGVGCSITASTTLKQASTYELSYSYEYTNMHTCSVSLNERLADGTKKLVEMITLEATLMSQCKPTKR